MESSTPIQDRFIQTSHVSFFIHIDMHHTHGHARRNTGVWVRVGGGRGGGMEGGMGGGMGGGMLSALGRER